jgi:hypothetical protein
VFELLTLLVFALGWFKAQARLEAENLIFRQQLIVLRLRRPPRAQLRNTDRLLFVWLYRLFPSLLSAITIVKPETVTRWRRGGFRANWRWQSCLRRGRLRIDGEIRDLIRRMSSENPLWGAPRIHGELLMLGIEVAQSTVASTWKDPGDRAHKSGRHFFAITPQESLRSICSSSARSRSSCSMAW